MLIKRLELSDPDVCLAAWRVQRAAYEVEAALIGSRGMAGLNESVADLSANRAETFWGCWAQGLSGSLSVATGERLGGVIAVERCDRAPWLGEAESEQAAGSAPVVVISRLAVDPALARRGIGRALVRWVVAVRAGDGVDAARRARGGVWVSTGAANTPARRLYEGEGFVLHRERSAPDGTALVMYRWGGS